MLRAASSAAASSAGVVALLLCLAKPAQEPLLPANFSRAEDLSDAGLAFVELAPARDTCVLGEVLELRLRFGFERAFLSEHLVQLFQRALDVPAQVFAPALEGHAGVRFLDGSEPEGGATFALGERITRAARLADETRAGGTFACFELTRRAVVLRPGTLALEAPVLCFAHATRFEDDFVQGRRPVDRREALVRGVPARIEVRQPPEEGRPAEFGGAIGRFALEVTAAPQDLVLGQALELRVHVTALDADADLSQAAEPRLADLADFHLRGSLVEREERGLLVRYDLVPLAEGALELPPVRFVSFDTTPPAGYRTLESAPIPLILRAAPASKPSPATPGGAPAAPSTSGGTTGFVALGGALLALAGAWLWKRRARARA